MSFYFPLNYSWKDFITRKNENIFTFRTGFFNHEYELYDSILLGFDGIFIYCQDLDKYKIQYLVEIGRDFHFPIIFIVHNKYELQTLLETDAPYLAISGYSALNFSFETSVFFQLASLVPKTANLMAWATKIEESKQLLHKNGYKIIFEAC